MARILVIEDEEDVVRVVTKMMTSRGHQVRTARDGIEGLAEIAADPPDVIIVDLNLPKMDGFEVCRRVKSDPATRQVPIVMMTAAYLSLDDADRGTSLGADEYVVKPFLRDVLVHNVERLLRPRSDEPS